MRNTDVMSRWSAIILISSMVIFSQPSMAAILGDVNLDGKIDLAESIYALQIAAGAYPDLPDSCLLNGKGEWETGTEYNLCDVVTYNSKTYSCITAHESEADVSDPTNPAYWAELSIRGINCWDSNENGQCDVASEDKDNSGDCSALDCQVASHEYEICQTFYKMDVEFPQFCQDYCSNVSPPEYCVEKVIFVSNTAYQGNLGETFGAYDADKICYSAAQAAGLSGSFIAWLSDSSSTVAQRSSHNQGPYILTDQSTRIAKNWMDLIDGTLLHPINLNASGSYVGTQYVWTGTSAAGSSTGKDCEDWTSNTGDPSIGGMGDHGEVGYTGSVNGGWTALGDRECDEYYRLYCIEQ